jgi:chorismate lyase/3-hydroxybenzoate synthase
MSIVSLPSRPASPAPHAGRDRSDPGVPRWVADLIASTRGEARAAAPDEPGVTVQASAAFTLVTVRRPGATDLAPAEFEACTRSAYATIARRLRDAAAPHAVRFWNYIPDIHRQCGGGGSGGGQIDRYMCFNAGRFAACSDWFGGPDSFERMLATGSGVGHAGPDLVIHALATGRPGTAVENPRQVPAYRYSARFGPRPPCFARATVIRPDGAAPLLLVGGTASIRGEESVHVGDLRAQTLETFENLASLVRSACGGAGGLERFGELRVYHSRGSDRDAIDALVRPAFPGVRAVEYVRADLCRRELAVEIEGVAAWSAA